MVGVSVRKGVGRCNTWGPTGMGRTGFGVVGDMIANKC